MPWQHDGSGGNAIWVDPQPNTQHQQQARSDYPRGKLVHRGTTLNDNDLPIGQRNTAEGPDGLLLFEELDGANRPHREFVVPAGQTKTSTWLAPFVTSPQRAMVWAGNGKSVKDMTAIKRRILAEERQLAEKGLGSFPAFDIERDKSRIRNEVGD